MYPEIQVAPKEPKYRVVHVCAICDAEIYEAEEFYDFGDLGVFCKECVDWAHEYGEEW